MTERLTIEIEVERTPEGEFVASCDALRAVASGDSIEEAMANLFKALGALFEEYG